MVIWLSMAPDMAVSRLGWLGEDAWGPQLALSKVSLETSHANSDCGHAINTLAVTRKLIVHVRSCTPQSFGAAAAGCNAWHPTPKHLQYKHSKYLYYN